MFLNDEYRNDAGEDQLLIVPQETSSSHAEGKWSNLQKYLFLVKNSLREATEPESCQSIGTEWNSFGNLS